VLDGTIINPSVFKMSLLPKFATVLNFNDMKQGKNLKKNFFCHCRLRVSSFNIYFVSCCRKCAISNRRREKSIAVITERCSYVGVYH